MVIFMNFDVNLKEKYIPQQAYAEESTVTQNIPNEILQLIFSKTCLEDRANISLVCHRWNFSGYISDE